MLDDIGYVQQERDEMEVLFTFWPHAYVHAASLDRATLAYVSAQALLESQRVRPPSIS